MTSKANIFDFLVKQIFLEETESIVCFKNMPIMVDTITIASSLKTVLPVNILKAKIKIQNNIP